MGSRTDRYKQNDIPTRSNKNKDLYKQVYNAYDEFENLIVPSNAREINPKDLNKEITSRQDYHRKRDYDGIINSDKETIRDERTEEVAIEKNEVYDINELLNKAVGERKNTEINEDVLSNNDYLKKLKLDNSKTNIEQVKELYEDLQEEEEEELMKTANLSLEILSDLKGNNEKTIVDAVPIKEEITNNDGINRDFYSTSYKFSKKDFDGEVEGFPDEEEEEETESGNGKFFLKILLLIFGILFVILVLLYFINYFNKV